MFLLYATLPTYRAAGSAAKESLGSPVRYWNWIRDCHSIIHWNSSIRNGPAWQVHLWIIHDASNVMWLSHIHDALSKAKRGSVPKACICYHWTLGEKRIKNHDSWNESTVWLRGVTGNPQRHTVGLVSPHQTAQAMGPLTSILLLLGCRQLQGYDQGSLGTTRQWVRTLRIHPWGNPRPAFL